VTRHNCRSPKGSAAVEFALVLPVILAVLVGVVEVAVVARIHLEVVAAAREGAREAAANPDPAGAVAAVNRSLGPLASVARITVRRPHVVGATAEVEVRLPHRLAAVVFGGMGIELRGRSSMRVER